MSKKTVYRIFWYAEPYETFIYKFNFTYENLSEAQQICANLNSGNKHLNHKYWIEQEKE